MNEFTEKFNELKTLPVRLYVVFVKEDRAYPVNINSSGRSVTIWNDPITDAQWEYWKNIIKRGQKYEYDYRDGKLCLMWLQ